MKISNKILLYFSVTVILLTVLSSAIVYILFAEYREEEFQQRQKQKVELTIKFLTDYKDMTGELTRIMDKLSIHDFYDERILVYDANKILIYKSIDDLKINKNDEVLTDLSPSRQWIETKEGKYDVIGAYIENGETHFYAVSKAYDEYGYTKLFFLRNTLIVITIAISMVVLLISYYLSKRIAGPITQLAEELGHTHINDAPINPIHINSTSYELLYLRDKFNELVTRTQEAFAFQKHAVHHISHELKTPIAVLVSELEKAQTETQPERKNKLIAAQVVQAKALGDIINTMLEIAKIESGQAFSKEIVRIDELIFELIAEKSAKHPAFQFDIQFQPEEFEDTRLSVSSNRILIRQALANLIDNCTKFSDREKATIILDGTQKTALKLIFRNPGIPLTSEEENYLFSHFFRSKGHANVPGFGLGLVLVRKIIQLQGGAIHYCFENGVHQFDIELPLS